MSHTITVSAVVMQNAIGEVLTVRKRGTSRLMFPGGKPEPGETAEQAAVREAAEELGVTLDPVALELLGEFTTAAANEADRLVTATVYRHPFVADATAGGEIEELAWVSPEATGSHLAPLLTEVVFPLLRRPRLRRIAVFTGSSPGSSDTYRTATAQFARTLAASGVGMVYGGGRVGLMGAAADAALVAGAEVLGVIPEALMRREKGHPGLTRLDVVADMHARKHRMAELADGFVALPGGAGTLEELFEVWTWQQLGFHTKPVGLLDVAGFWQPLITMLDQMTTQGFISAEFRRTLIVADDPAQLLAAMTRWHSVTGPTAPDQGTYHAEEQLPQDTKD